MTTAVLTGQPARADDAKKDSGPPTGLPDASIATSLPILADPAGIRSALAARGVTFQINSITEALGDVSGGAKRGAVLDGRVEVVVDADLSKSLGLSGTTAHANAYEIYGGGLSRSFVGNLAVVSSIEAIPSTRLYEAWVQQAFAGGKVTVRAGQLGADVEFITSSFAGLYVNSAFGWPTVTAVDLPSGGPAYPLATPAIRLAYSPDDKNTLLLGVFDGDPAGPGPGDPQRRDADGLRFRVTDAPFAIGELQHHYDLGDGSAPLPGTLKLGAWGHAGRFDDLRFGTDGLPLANPASDGDPLRHGGDYGLYGVVDQQIYKLPSADDPQKGVGVFARVLLSPQDDRNLVTFEADGGITLNGVIASRPDDSFGVAASVARLSRQAGLADLDAAASGLPMPQRDAETLVEATYQAQIVPGFTVQPVAQYIVHPGGGIANPFSPVGTPIRNAAVIGVRTTIDY